MLRLPLASSISLAASIALAPMVAYAGPAQEPVWEEVPPAAPAPAPVIGDDPTTAAPVVEEGPAAPVAEAGPAPAPKPLVVRQTGVGLIVGGSILTVVPGVLATWGGASWYIAARQCGDEIGIGWCPGLGLSIFVLGTGVLSMAGGLTMLGFGIHQNVKYKQYKREQGLVWAPYSGSTRNRTRTYGLQLRF